jgi:hypothetical protein
MTLSWREANRLGHAFIGAEHILRGVLAEGSGVAFHVLRNMGVDLDAVRVAVGDLLEQVAGSSSATSGQLPFSPDSKRVLEDALAEAGQLGHNYIGTEHLLLGLLAAEEDAVGNVLRGCGVDSQAVRTEVLEFLGERADRRDYLPPKVLRDAFAARSRRASARGMALVLLPPGDRFARLYGDVLLPSLRDAGVDVVEHETSVDEAEVAVPPVLDRILGAELLLAVITGRDAGVMYRLGMAHGIGREVMLLIEQGERMAMHLRSLACVRYVDDDDGRTRLLQELTATVRTALEQRRRR